MRVLLLAWLLAMTCSHNRQAEVTQTATGSVKETEHKDASGTTTTVETHTKAPSEINSSEATDQYGWVPPAPDAPDAGYQWKPVQTTRKEKTAKIGQATTQRKTDSGWLASAEGTKGAETATGLKVKTSDVGETSAGPGRAFWVILSLGVAVALVLAALLYVWLRSKKKG